ncbi:hypothetical protein [Laribacter hongkongensis]|uniref:hypothetical protein n=1 Tax=Laribacter hongkongensis TaxID=168471 RepID=UPI00117ED417|nr:hypothetical protein [Laribacter hongkongensis]
MHYLISIGLIGFFMGINAMTVKRAKTIIGLQYTNKTLGNLAAISGPLTMLCALTVMALAFINGGITDGLLSIAVLIGTMLASGLVWGVLIQLAPTIALLALPVGVVSVLIALNA